MPLASGQKTQFGPASRWVFLPIDAADQLLGVRVRGRCRSRGDAELDEDVGDVTGDRLLADEQRG